MSGVIVSFEINCICCLNSGLWRDEAQSPPGGEAECSYDERLVVDVVQVKGQDVVLAAHVHAVMVLVHPQDPVIRCVEQEGEMMSCPCRPQLCRESERERKKEYFIQIHL